MLETANNTIKYRKKKRKTYKNKYIAGLLTVLLTALTVYAAIMFCKLLFPEVYDNGFVPAAYGKNISERVKKAQGLTVPDYVDNQIIKVHGSARTGAQLTDIADIVIHYVGNPGTDAQNNRDYFNNNSTEVSAHFVVGLDGKIIQCLPLWEKSAATNVRNIDTISIEVCHPDDSGKFNDATYESVVKLTAWLCGAFDLDKDNIIRHYDVTGKICPKYYVENPEAWEKFTQDVMERLDSYEK